MSARRAEHGSAAVFTTVLAGVLVTVAVAASVLGGLLVGQRRAAVAADLAALAGADALGPAGSPGPSRSTDPAAASGPVSFPASAGCARAAETARANGAVLSACQVVGPDLLVSATVEVSGPFASTWTVVGTARAGPATGPGGRGR